MTVEELEIIVTAKVEEALKEFKKVAPTVKKMVQDVQNAMQNVNTDVVKNKVAKAVQIIKNKIGSLKKSSEDNKIKIDINNKEAKKQITQLEKEIDSLQKKITASRLNLDIISPKLDMIYNNTAKAVTPDGVDTDSPAMQKTINASLGSNKEYQSLYAQETKLIENIKIYNEQLSQAKFKLSELKSGIQDSSTRQNKLTGFFSAFKQRIEQAKTSVANMKGGFKSLPKITQNITNNIKGIGKNMKNGIGQVLKYAGALFSLRSIYSILSGCARSWLSSQNKGAQQLSANIEYMKYAMGSAFAPVIQYVTNLVYQLLKAIQSLVYAFSGVNIFAKATASSMKSASGSASKTSKSLAGVHSEINNVSENNSGSSGNTTPNIDMTSLDAQMSPLAQKLYDFFKPLVDSWKTYGGGLIEQVKTTASQIGGLISTVWGSFETIITNGTVYSILENILATIGNIAEAFANAWKNDGNGTEILQGIANMLNDITGAISNLASSTGVQKLLDGIVSAFSGIVQFMEPIVSGFAEMSEKIADIVLSGIGDVLKAIGDAFQSIVQNETVSEILKAVGEAIAIIAGAIVTWNIAQTVLNVLIGIFNVLISPITLIILAIVAAITAIILIIKNWATISEWFQELWVKITDKLKEVWESVKTFFVNLWQGICDTAKSVWNRIKDFLSDLWQGIKNIVQTVFNAIATFFSNIWTGIKNTVSNVWNGITTTISNVINKIKTTISNVLNSIKTVWNNIWNGIKTTVVNIWNGIWNGIKSVINKILGGIESFVNGIIKGINKLLSGISNVASAVGSIFGIKPVSLQLSTMSLPRLAKGNVAYSETVAVFGEYSGARNNPEITAPQNVLRETFSDVLAEHEYGKPQDAGMFKQLIIQLGSMQVAVEIDKLIQQARRQNGTAKLTI